MRGYDEVIAICPSVSLPLPPIIYLSAHTSTQPASQTSTHPSASPSSSLSLICSFLLPSISVCTTLWRGSPPLPLLSPSSIRSTPGLSRGLLVAFSQEARKVAQRTGECVVRDPLRQYRCLTPPTIPPSTPSTTPPPRHPVPRASLTNVCSRKERIDRGIFKKMMRNQRRLGLLSILDSSVGL